MTQPNETESVQTYGLAEGDRVEFEIEEPQRWRKGRQAINVKIGILGFWLHQFRAQPEVREMSSCLHQKGEVEVPAGGYY